MSLGFDSAVLMISSYSNPIETLRHAQEQGYHITDYMVKPMPFGYYSSEPKVTDGIWQLCSLNGLSNLPSAGLSARTKIIDFAFLALMTHQ